VDGDGTYPADKVRALIDPILSSEADMVIGSRLLADTSQGFSWSHLIGNRTFRFLLNRLFRVRITDLLSGYRAMTRDVVKGVPFLSRGFESETELTVKCLERGYQIMEVPVTLAARPAGGQSKIRLVQDGAIILNAILSLARDYKPLTTFGSVGAAFVIAGLLPGVVVIREFFMTGLISHLPSAVLAVGLVLSGLIIVFIGLVLHTIARRFQELDYQLRMLLKSDQHDRGEAPRR